MKPLWLSLLVAVTLTACRVTPHDEQRRPLAASRWELSRRNALLKRQTIASQKRLERIVQKLKEAERHASELKQIIKSSGLSGFWCFSDIMTLGEENTRLEKQMTETANSVL
jgi:hypothetical protein